MSTVSAATAAALAVLAVLMVAGSAEAGPRHGRGKAKTAAPQSETSNFSADIGVSIHIGDDESRIVRDYYADSAHCPPGLAKKHNGCLPPGQAKKHYRVGYPIPDSAVIVELPYGVIVKLPILPRGREYRLIDGDLAVVDVSTHVVLDARVIF